MQLLKNVFGKCNLIINIIPIKPTPKTNEQNDEKALLEIT